MNRFVRYIVVRVLGAMGTIVGVSVISFFLMRVLPGDPVRLALGLLASEKAVEAQRVVMGLDKPLIEQYFRYVSGFVTGDWGFAYSVGAPVKDLFIQRLPATLELSSIAFAIAFSAAILVSLVSVYRRRRWVNELVRGVTFLGLGTPPFWLAILLLLIFAQQLAILPGPEGRLSLFVSPPPTVTGLLLVDSALAMDPTAFGNALWHLVLPALVLAFGPFALLVRILRSNLLEVSGEPFVIVARGKGNGRWRAATHHMLPNAALPTITIGGLLFAELLVGGVLIERIFAWPGIGALSIEAISRQEFGIVQAFILLSAISYVTISLIVDLVIIGLDPRIRSEIGVKG